MCGHVRAGQRSEATFVSPAIVMSIDRMVGYEEEDEAMQASSTISRGAWGGGTGKA